MAASVKNDPALIERATNSLLARGLRRQVTREAIARKTLVLLHEDETPPGSTAGPEHHRVDDDWLNTFERYAEDVSSERLQDIWARVLVGEIRKPKTFSLQTLRFLAELDEEIATTFERWVPAVLFGELIPFPPNTSPPVLDMIRLEECGLISSPLGSLSKTFNFHQPGPQQFPYKTHSLIVQIEAPQRVVFPAAFLTRVGREIYSISHPPDKIEHARHFATALTKDNVSNIFYLPTALYQSGSATVSDPSVITLWSKPA